MSAEAKRPIDILRERRGPVPDALRQHVREHNSIQKAITDSLSEGPKTAPEIAAAIAVPAQQVLWHLMVMRKYGETAEGDQEGDYFQYMLTEKDR
jgi:predicted transcriptional regulator